MLDLRTRERIAWAGTIGAVLGVIAFFLVSFWVDRSYFPSVVAGEDYGYEYLLRLPMGIFLGAMTGIVVSPVWERPAVLLARTSAVLSLGFILGLWLLFTLVPDQSLFSREFYLPVPFLWAAGLVMWSIGTLIRGHLPKTSRAFSMACCGLVLLLIGIGGWSGYPLIQQKQKNGVLIAAIKNDEPKTVEALLENGADANTRDVTDHRAFWQRLWDLVRYRKPVSSGPSALEVELATYPMDDTPIWKRSEPMLLALLKHGADPNVKNDSGLTLLMWACVHDDKPLAQVALKQGANVNTCDENGDTPLMFAVGHGDAEIVHALLSHGADVSIMTQFGVSDLLNALRDPPNTAIVRMLLEHGAEVNVQDEYGNTPLTEAVAAKRPDLVSLLKRYGAKW